jgi:glycosyltransferase involved in cell wall biosynthesis
MRIAIIHYHFNKGGVRSVVENAGHALAASDLRFCVLTGEPLPEDGAVAAGTLPQSGMPYRVLPELAYGAEASPGLAERARGLAAEVLGGAPDLWHFHNHSLGKNGSVPALAAELVSAREPVLLQIHDFAEDGRPDNYAYLREAGLLEPGRGLYPGGGRVHYAVLNGRDAGFLKRAGAERVHLLPNAVHVPAEEGATLPPTGESPLYLYPTRAIRRKNIGEFLLWARLRGENTRFAVTMAPANPVEKPIYEAWVALAAELGLPVEWEYGTRSGLGFPALMASAERVVTTSVGEGFGLAFLEPWLFGRPVAGRDLPEITRDFTAEGLRFPGLYEALPVRVDRRELRTSYERALAGAFGSYGRVLREAELEAAWAEVTAGGFVDFAKLDEAGQAWVIREGARFVDLPEVPAVGPEVLEENRRIIAERYGPAAYGRRLEEVYRAVAEGARDAENEWNVDGARLLECFLAPSRFTPLRGLR